LCHEPENYESEIFEFRRNERYAPKGEKETSGELADRLKRETGLTPQQLSKKLYNHISEEIGEGTPEEYMRRIEEMRTAGTLPDMEEFMQMVIQAYLDASKK
jgi:hypothetical protein